MDGKTVVAISDLHCGHRVGLTPPRFQIDPSRGKWGHVEAQLWEAYTGMIDRRGHIDILIVNGDCIEGKGVRSGGTEIIEADRNKQCEMAIECINYAKASKVIMTYGTGYHTGSNEDFEDTIAREINAEKIGGQEWVDVNGLIFDIKHKTGSTTVPYSKGTAISKDRLWNLLWAEHDEQPLADILIRSHVHYFFFCGGDNWLGVVTPALQGQGSKFGSRICQGHVDFGLTYYHIKGKGDYTWGWDIARVASQKQHPIRL